MIVQPDPYMTVKYVQQIQNNMCMSVNNISWEEKKPAVYFHGALTGKVYGENGEYINRLKLMHMSVQNPD